MSHCKSVGQMLAEPRRTPGSLASFSRPASNLIEHTGAIDPFRRMVLATALAMTAAWYVMPALAAPGTETPYRAFLALSKYLTAHRTFPLEQTMRLYHALIFADARFGTAAMELAQLLQAKDIDPLQLQHLLDSDHPLLAPLPRIILTAWYTGIVGEGASARCIMYETSLMNGLVNDRLRPPSYCYGDYGSWMKSPA